LTTPAADTAPYPIPDSDSERYWAALSHGKVTYQRCERCGAKQLYFRALCRECWSSDLVIETSAGNGTVYSYTVLNNVGNPVLAREAPLIIALVDLDEGPRVLGRIEDAADLVQIGARVGPTFRQLDAGPTLLHFHLADASGGVGS
jgi:uncharacterized OB-fold protein